MNILVAEDDPELAKLIIASLQRLGHSVTAVTDGRLGLKSFKEGSFDLILTDLVMPHKDGLELITAVRRLDPHVKIIAVSGGYRINSLDMMALAKASGANEILYKPFGIAELEQAVALQLGQ